MRWSGQQLERQHPDSLPGLARLNNLVRTVRTPEFAGITFYEVLAKSALNKVPGAVPGTPYGWTINPYRGCSHACVYCFARPTHAYLDFADAGATSTPRSIVKVNVGEVLGAELAPARLVAHAGRARHEHRPVPAGGGALPADAGHARGARRLRDPGLGAHEGHAAAPRPAAAHPASPSAVPVDLAMSIAVFDDELQHAVEPGTPSTAARLATVAAAREAGLPCGVFLMPVLPYLTDTVAHLDRALEAIKAADASYVLWSALHLKPGVREWYLDWLGSHASGAPARVPVDVRQRCRTRRRPTGSGSRPASGPSSRSTGSSSAAPTTPPARCGHAPPG